jgi:hypothetical protein
LVAVSSSQLIRSLVGGWTFSYRRLAPLSKGRVSYPLGRLDVYEDKLVFRARGLLRFLIPERVVPLASITGIKRSRGPLGRFSGVRVSHDSGETTWASRGRESEGWIVEYVETHMNGK